MSEFSTSKKQLRADDSVCPICDTTTGPTVEHKCHCCGRFVCGYCTKACEEGGLVCAECAVPVYESRFYLRFGLIWGEMVSPGTPMRHNGDFALARGDGFKFRAAGVGDRGPVGATSWATREEAAAVARAITHSYTARPCGSEEVVEARLVDYYVCKAHQAEHAAMAQALANSLKEMAQ